MSRRAWANVLGVVGLAILAVTIVVIVWSAAQVHGLLVRNGLRHDEATALIVLGAFLLGVLIDGRRSRD